MSIIGLGNKRILPPPYRPAAWGFGQGGGGGGGKGRIPFGGKAWGKGGLKPNGNGGGVLDDFESGNLDEYQSYEGTVPVGSGAFSVVDFGVPEGDYCIAPDGGQESIWSILHDTGLSPRGWEYRFTVRRADENPPGYLMFLFAVQDILHCYSVLVSPSGNSVMGGECDGAPVQTDCGDAAVAAFDDDTNVVVFVRWDDAGLLTYGTVLETKTFQTSLGYTTGKWGFRQGDRTAPPLDRYHVDYLVQAALP